jgi:hypothetical protein
MNLLTAYIHGRNWSNYSATTISVLHKSPQHPLSLFQPAVFSPAVPWQQLLTVEIFQLHAFRFCLHSFLCRTAYKLSNDWVWTELLYYDRRSVGQSVLISSPHLGLMTRFFYTVRHLRVCWYGVSSLTRGRICLLQLLLSSPAQSFSGPSPAGLMTTFYCFRFETPPTWRTRSLYLYPPGTGWPGYTPRHWVIPLNSDSLLVIPFYGQSRKHRFQ